jgi:nicotinate phosphoribosyltransferase
VFRVEANGRAVRDVIARAVETLPGRPLLRPVMRGGCRLPEGTIDLQAARSHAQEEIARLPEHIRAIRPAARRYPVEISATLRAYQDEVAREVELANRDAAPTPARAARRVDPHQ